EWQTSQMPPEFAFSVGHIATESTSSRDASVEVFRSLTSSHARPPPLPPPHHSQELAGGGERHRHAFLTTQSECANNHPSTLPIWRTASSIRLASASQNALNSAWSR